ncbi:MAG: FmdE family protein [Syntrophales bacterium]|jgi:formylmethanofuran dehydrogenase subunit E|nr:FmdE family protein [Syntrophales bacterium]
MMNFNLLLERSVKIHGHLCPGQVLGVKMAMLGMELIGLGAQEEGHARDLIVYVEMDRCATDAIQSVTGCSLGHRTMKFLDYGKMAATFVNIETGLAVRVIAREDTRDKAKELFPDIEDRYEAQIQTYMIMPQEELFDVMRVHVVIPPEDMPGRPLRRIQCARCGEQVQDMREVHREGEVLCKACAEGTYYRPCD